MTKLSLPQISMEAINYQGRSLLFFDLVAAIDKLRSEPTSITQKDLDAVGLQAVTFERTKMSVKFDLAEAFGADESCYAEPPLMDAANPYYKLLGNLGFANARQDILERNQRTLRMATDSLAWVNLKAGQVGGVFSQMQCRVIIPVSLLNDANFTSEEIAAILLHELGHLFFYFETLAYSTASNTVIATATEALRGVSDKPEKLRLISQAVSVFNQDVGSDTIETIADSSDDSVVRGLLLRTFEEGEQLRTKGLTPDRNATYNTRSIEHMADQFAIRHGAGMALAMAQHKMAKLHFPDYGRSRAGFFAVQAIRASLLILTVHLAPIMGLVLCAIVSMLMAASADDADYNADPSERIGRMKQDLVQLLKNTRLDQKLRDQILQDIDAIDAIRGEIKEHSGYFRFLWRNVTPIGRRQAKIREFQKGLEGLINNNLFIHANRFRSI